MTTLWIKSWSSPDIDFSWEPAGEADVCFFLELEIGERADERADLFYIQVATPEGLRAALKPSGTVLADRAVLIISEYSWRGVQLAVEGIVPSCAADTWTECVLHLQRHFRWEYEDYVMEH